MSDYIVTGRTGGNHVTAADAGALNACFAGEGRYVAAGVGEALAAEVISNNCVRIKSGEAINQGRHMRVSANTYVDCTIQNGSQNTKRYDLIVFRYTRNVETDIEKAEIVVIHGTPASTASDPTYTAGNILAGARQDDMLLYRVRINGINIEAVDKLFTELPSLAALNEKRVDLTGRVSNVEKAVSQLNSEILKHGQVDVTVTLPSGFSTVPIQTASEFNDTLRLYGITTVYAIWIDNGYGDQWQLTASTYNGGLSLQCYSKWGGSLERSINIHILGI